jgi:hypothetical protein
MVKAVPGDWREKEREREREKFFLTIKKEREEFGY